MSEVRLPAQLEVSGLVRRVNGEGGFATIMAKGEPDAGTILVLTSFRGEAFRAWERMPQADGNRRWECVRQSDSSGYGELAEWLERRKTQDPDLWIVELDIAEAERFIGLTPSTD